MRILLAILAFFVVLGPAILALAQPTRVAAIGDSITFGAGTSDPATESYPAQLQTLLGTAYDVQNFGRSGADVLSINNGPYAGTQQHLDALDFIPEIVISNLGINDWALFLDNQELFVSDYVALLNQYSSLPTNPSIFIWTELGPVFPANSNSAAIEAQRDQANVRLAEVAATVGALGINMYSPLIDHPELFPDGLHPNADGAAIIAETTATFAFGALPNEVIGDVNQNGVVFGDGAGPFETDDVTAFIQGWLTDTSSLSPLDRTLAGDLNLDGVTSLADAFILHEALLDQGGAFPFNLLRAVPEPGSMALLFFGFVLSPGRLRRTGQSPAR